MKKLYTILVFMLVVSMSLTACGSTASDNLDCRSADVFCIGLVTDIGKINDNSYNQSIWAAVEQAKKDLDAQGEYIETTEKSDYDKNISYFTESGYDVVVTTGSALDKATAQAAANYPNIMFIGVDQFQNPDEPSPSNLIGLIIPKYFLVGALQAKLTKSESIGEDQAGFLVGAIAARMTKSQKIGAVCATDAPPLWRFGEGYKAGAAYINPSVEVTVTYHDPNSADFTDPEWSTRTAQAMIDNGSDVIFGAGDGKSGNYAVSLAAQKGVYALGIDSDESLAELEVQELLFSETARPTTIILFELFKLAKDGEFLGSSNYVNKIISYAPFHELTSQIPADIREEIDGILNGLLEGSIKTNVPETKP